LGLHSNCTMLYGHIETEEDRVDHLLHLRELQDGAGDLPIWALSAKYLTARRSQPISGSISGCWPFA
jgi:2-iminoacetate synthase ThiH